MNTKASTWAPSEFSPIITQRAEILSTNMAKRDHLGIDSELAASAFLSLEHAVAPELDRILERDSLPQLCHLINGWGNASYKKKSFLSRYDDFVEKDSREGHRIPQCHPEGDFHAGQSLAYAAMAGETSQATVGADGPTLRELTANSRFIEKDDPAEFGHLLFAIALLDPRPDRAPFVIAGHEQAFRQVVDSAVKAHFDGHFNVCRKFHATEGICAVAALLPGFEYLRPQAQEFLNGQLANLLPLHLMRLEMQAVLDGSGSQDIIAEIRETLVMGQYIENEYYYVGHAAELQSFSELLGYRVHPSHKNSLCALINALNSDLPAVLPRVSLADSFLHFGHYRRGASLSTQVSSQRGGEIRNTDLSKYKSTFKHSDRWDTSQPSTLNSSVLDTFYQMSLAPSKPAISSFEMLIHSYNKISSVELRAKGDFPHFRRIAPINWPRTLHYEFLASEASIGIEVHCEERRLRPCANQLMSMVPQLKELPGFESIGWDPAWWNGGGRLALNMPKDTPSVRLINSMQALIEATATQLNQALLLCPTR